MSNRNTRVEELEHRTIFLAVGLAVAMSMILILLIEVQSLSDVVNTHHQVLTAIVESAVDK